LNPGLGGDTIFTFLMPDVKTKAKGKTPDPALQAVIIALRARIKSVAPETTEFVNPWGLPTFELKEPFAYFMIAKKHVTLGFHYGTSLADPHKLLEGTGKDLRNIKLRTADDLNRAGLNQLILAAARFQPAKPKTMMRSKR
jgi:hypothetical protein